MNRLIFFFTVAATFAAIVSCSHKTEKVQLNDQRDSISWAIGENTAIGMQNIGYDFNVDMVVRAIEHTLKGQEQPFSDQAYADMLAKLTNMMQQNFANQQKKSHDAAAVEEKKLFDELMKNDPEVKKSDDGFYYKVIKKGNGPNVKKGEVAVFDYRGYILKDNQFIDQTYEVREPIETLVGGGMFRGLQMGMQLMNAGSIYRLYFPNELAFGAKGTDVIPPYTAIYYDVELHSFHP